MGEILCVFPEVYCLDDFTATNTSELLTACKDFQLLWEAVSSASTQPYSLVPKASGFIRALWILPRTFLNTRDYATDMNFFQVMLQGTG